MPVEYRPVHPKTIERPDARYGCFNRPPFAYGYMAPDGYSEIMDDAAGFLDARIKLSYITHTMTTDCQYDMAKGDRKCAGCRHMKGA